MAFFKCPFLLQRSVCIASFSRRFLHSNGTDKNHHYLQGHLDCVSDPPNIWSLDQNSFQLFSAVQLNTIKIGDILEFRLTLTPQESFAEPDTLIFEISASYNGYSCLIFCGDPKITFKNTVFPFSRYGVTYDQVFEGISVRIPSNSVEFFDVPKAFRNIEVSTRSSAVLFQKIFFTCD